MQEKQRLEDAEHEAAQAEEKARIEAENAAKMEQLRLQM